MKVYPSAVILEDGSKHCFRIHSQNKIVRENSRTGAYATPRNWMSEKDIKLIQSEILNGHNKFDSIIYIATLKCKGEKSAREFITSQIVKIEFLVIENNFYDNPGYVDRYGVDFKTKKVFYSRWNEDEKSFSTDVESEKYEYVEYAQELRCQGVQREF